MYVVLWAMDGSRFGEGGWVGGSIFDALPGEIVSTSYLAGDWDREGRFFLLGGMVLEDSFF